MCFYVCVRAAASLIGLATFPRVALKPLMCQIGVKYRRGKCPWNEGVPRENTVFIENGRFLWLSLQSRWSGIAVAVAAVSAGGGGGGDSMDPCHRYCAYGYCFDLHHRLCFASRSP